MLKHQAFTSTSMIQQSKMKNTLHVNRQNFNNNSYKHNNKRKWNANFVYSLEIIYSLAFFFRSLFLVVVVVFFFIRFLCVYQSSIPNGHTYTFFFSTWLKSFFVYYFTWFQHESNYFHVIYYLNKMHMLFVYTCSIE